MLTERITWKRTLQIACFLLSTPAFSAASATDDERVLQVGPGFAIKTLADAAKVAKDGDVIEVKGGDYYRDVAVWTQNKLTLRAAPGGRVRMIAGGKAAEGKAIWVVRGGDISVSGFDFVGARVMDRNGAGIRLERGRLLIDDCRFLENENGILTSGDAQSRLEIRNSEFGHNGYGDGQSHNLYVGAIEQLKVTGSYFHHARVGHLLKSRARQNHILANRLTDEIGGQASYELEFPNGGVAYVVGNIIQQSSTSENPHLVSFGAEGYGSGANELYLAYNTFVDLLPKGGVFLRAAAGARIFAANNLLLGDSRITTAGPGEYVGNYTVDFEDFVMAPREDYRLRPGSRFIGKALPLPAKFPGTLLPAQEYKHPRTLRTLDRPPTNPGALQ